MCPFGLVQDLLYKIPFMKKMKKLPGDRFLVWIKYMILALFVILLPMFAVDFTGQGEPWFCKYFCPSGILMGGIPLYAVSGGIRRAAGLLYAVRFIMLILLLLLSIMVYRPFCRYLCPLGAIYGFFNPIAFTRYRVDEARCTSCGKCREACKMDIDASLTPNHLLCIRCGDCKKACPENAITCFSKDS